MDLEYFKENILDELAGAKDYIIRAIEIKPMQITWSKMLFDMSLQELGHATHLYNMFNEYCSIMGRTYADLPEYVKEIRNEIVEEYAKQSAEIKLMQESLK